jgi:hypothetical protein
MKDLRERCEKFGKKIDQTCPPGKTCEDLIEEFAREIRNEALSEALKALVFSEAAQRILHSEIIYHREEWRRRNEYSDALRCVDEAAANSALLRLKILIDEIRALKETP